MSREEVNNFLNSEREAIVHHESSDFSSEKMDELENKIKMLENTLEEERAARQHNLDEWNIIREDLLMAVKIANESDRKSADRIDSLEKENIKLKKELNELQIKFEDMKTTSPTLASPVEKIEKPTLETKVSVKTMVKSLEDVNKPKPDTSVKDLIDKIEGKK